MKEDKTKEISWRACKFSSNVDSLSKVVVK